MHHTQGAHLLRGVIRRPHQRIRLDPLEADLFAVVAQFGEFFHGVITIHRHVLLAGLQILTDGQNVHAPTALVTHHGFDLVHGFA